MSVLRDQLEKESPELFRALERSWEIAENEWLPALGAQNDSYNSYPHLKNLESYLDHVVIGFELLADAGKKPFISPTEIYILLSSILFHDIGRIRAQATGVDQHAQLSQRTVDEHWGRLGIQSVELARSIAKICDYHDCSPEESEKLRAKLKDVVIDPYGEVREWLLACLLVLVDHLDGAFSRVLPQYIRSHRNLKEIGAFRNVVRGVYVDPFCQLVRTVLNDDFPGVDVEDQEQAFRYSINSDQGRSKELRRLLREGREIPQELLPRYELSTDTISRKKLYGCDELLSLFLVDPSWEKLTSQSSLMNFIYDQPTDLKPELRLGFHSHEWLAVRGLVFIKKTNPDIEWPAKRLLAMILGNIRENREALEGVRDQLTTSGFPLRSWVIDYREHLYDDWGRETFEPIFSKDYLVRIAEGMWKLTTTIFGSSHFTYENLAAEIRDPRIERVKAAVRRLGIVAGQGNAIISGNAYWKWSVSSPVSQSGCHYHSLKEVKSDIDCLSDPSLILER